MSAPSWANGSVVILTHVATGASLTVLVEKDKAQLTFCRIEGPYEKLKVTQNDGETAWGAGGGKFASFVTSSAGGGDPDGAATMAFQLCANQKKENTDGSEGWYLGVSSSSSSGVLLPHGLRLVGNAGPQPFVATEVTSRAQMSLSTATQHGPSLTSTQIETFCREGYLVLPGAVPLPLVHDALRRINHELGKPGMMIEGGVEGAAKLAGNTSNHPAILDLYRPIEAAVESLVGAGCAVPPQGAQLALRFPEVCPPYEPKGTEWHTDGMRQGKWNPFSLLVGISLSNVPAPQSGNLLAFPRTHHTLHAMLQEGGLLHLCTSSDAVWGHGQLPDLGPPTALLLAKGDVVLAHPKMAHRGGPNFSPDIRYQIYYRIKHKHHAARQRQLETDLFADLDGCHTTT
ncbi:Aste57867_13102 [Aphanomyces stellatus]|uniref:Aste57867_13102 protein n=1 Tax=Aphanomyces stellatus TaxID=120398 RepID=A0A485KX99_9STRA|nr:hypothetical protein As57867_013054 [Aphanomyces stellatus]VFT89946.1 Aste57867_13102 [Aphanomyces stellatus]